VSTGQTIPGCDSYAPDNYDHSGGIDDMVEAITESNNVFHVKLAEHVGQDTVVEMAARLGVDTKLEPYCALALGVFEVFPLEMAEAYATLANRGVHCEPYSIVEVLDRSGEPLLRRKPDCERVVKPEVADTVTSLLQNVVEEGTAQRARIGTTVAAKTGTTVDNRDAWLIGYTRELATAAWVGFEQPSPMEGILGYRTISGGTVPAEIWSAYMQAAMEIIGDPQSLGTADLEVYRQPNCPSPPDRGDDDDRKGRNGEKKPGGNDPWESFRHDGFIETDVDGDDFEEGHQPETCVQ
jgi:penicillin-binding protein 1A